MIKSQFSYCPLTLKFSSRQSNTLINKIHERSLRLIANDDNNNFETLFQNNRDITVHHSKFRSSCPEVYLRKGVLKIYSKFTGEHPKPQCNFNKVAKHFIRTLAWVFSCKFAAYFQNTFS